MPFNLPIPIFPKRGIATPPFLPPPPMPSQVPPPPQFEAEEPSLGVPRMTADAPEAPMPPPMVSRPEMPELPKPKEVGGVRKVLGTALQVAGFGPVGRGLSYGFDYDQKMRDFAMQQGARKVNSEIAENEAQTEAERARGGYFTAQTNAKETPKAEAVGTFGWYDRDGKWHDAATKPPAEPNEYKPGYGYRDKDGKITVPVPAEGKTTNPPSRTIGNKIYERQPDGKWKEVAQGPVTSANQNPETDAAMEELAESLAKGDLSRLRDVASLRSDQRLIAFYRARQKNPNFNTAEIDRKIKMEDYYTNGKGADNLRSFDIFLQHAGAASDAVNGIRLSNSPIINKPVNWWRKNASGAPEYQQFIASLEPVRKELESFLLGGRALYAEDRRAAEIILNENSSPAQIQAALKTMAHTAKARFQSENFRYKRTVGKDLENPLSPEAMEGAKKVGVDMAAPEGKLFNGGSQKQDNKPSAMPPPEDTQPQPMERRNKSTGQVIHSLDGGETWYEGPAPKNANPNPAALTQAGTAQPDTSAIQKKITDTSTRYGVDPKLALAVAHKESRFNPNATGSKGDGGLFQLLPGTAKQLGVTDVYDPDQNIDGGVRHLAYLLKKYNGDRAKALMAYNGGEGNVDRGTVSDAAKTYAATVLSQLGQGD